MLPWLFLIAYLVILFASLTKLFAKAGQPSWAALVPGYNFYIWNKVLGKPWYWLFLLLVPGINLLMLIIMNVNTSIVFGEKELKQHVIAVFTPWYTLPKLAFKPEYKYAGPNPPEKRKRAMVGQWGDAILFAVIVATTFRVFTFEAFTIPTESEEKTLLVGDYLFVSKLSYGARLPMTPISFPFTHHTLFGTEHTPSFTRWFSLGYFRLPGFSTPQRGDAVVFNFPEGDTVVADMQNQSYYQLLRQYGRDTVWNEALRFQSKDENGNDKMIGFGHILVRPVDKQENYIKRCVAIAGDSVEVLDGVLFVNGKESPLPPMGQYAYGFKIRDRFNLKSLKDNLDITTTDVNEGGDTAVIPLTIERANQMSKFRNVIAMVRQNKLRGVYGKRDGWPIFPNDPRYDWSEDNFGPLWIPKTGATINLTLLNLPLYKRAISLYEHNDLEVKDGSIWINGEKTDHYTFKQDYYWMMGDNRHRSQDARFWGFVPFDHVVGKAVMVWLTADPEQGGFPRGIRWKRVFSFVK